MIHLNVKRVMNMRGVPNGYKMLLKLGFAPSTARKFLRKDVSRIDLVCLEKLCLALNCTPNDIFEWQPPESMINAGENALGKLRRDGEEDIAKLLKSLPMEKVEQFAGIIQKLNDE